MTEESEAEQLQTGKLKLFVLALLLVTVGSFFLLGLDNYLSLEKLQQGRAALESWVRTHPALARGSFFLVYVLVTALSLPGAAVMTLAAGALFGLVSGFLLASFASSIGATVAMLMARLLFGDWVQGRYGAQLTRVNEGLERDGGLYLFSLRMVPLFPFFVINLVMGITRMRAWSFYWISQLGMVPGTLVFVFAGTQLAEIDSVGAILSPGLLLAFTLLGVFPLAARKLMQVLRPAAS